MARFKAEQSTIPRGNLMPIYVFYHILLFIEDYILLGRFELEDEAPDLLGVETKISTCRSDGDFILDYGHEC